MLDWGTWPREAGPQGPGWVTLENGKKTLMAINVGVNMLQVCSVSNSLSHITLLIKWEVYFSKNCVARLYCVSSLWFCMHIHMCLYSWSWLYNTVTNIKNSWKILFSLFSDRIFVIILTLKIWILAINQVQWKWDGIESSIVKRFHDCI